MHGIILRLNKLVSADSAQVPPVPMPNTEVKLSSAENTWMETSWEDREVLTFIFLQWFLPLLFLLYNCHLYRHFCIYAVKW